MSVESGYIDLEDMSGSEGRPSPTSSVFLPLNELMDRVRTFVRERGIMLEDCFHDYDPLRTGYVSASDFNKALKEVFEELLTDEQVEEIQNQYCVHSSPDCLNWSKFLHDAETEEPSVPQNNNMQPQKTELLKRIARLMKGKMDLSNLLCQTSSQNSKRNGENGYTIDKQAEDVPRLLATVIEKEELKAIMDMYTDENGFKCHEFLQDLKKVEECHKKSRPPSRSSKVSPTSLGFFIDIPEDQVHSSKSSKLPIKRSRKPFSISYEALVWIIFTIVTTLCVVDRFVLKGDVVLGRAAKFPKRLWGTNIGETITNVVWGVTARMIITSQNLMFYTMLWCVRIERGDAMALGGLAGINCHCQWGLTGLLGGIVIMLAAGVFTALPVFFGWFCYQWYYALCWFWFLLGVAMTVFGAFYECFCFSPVYKSVQAREWAEEDGSGPASAPTPYIMIQ